jgi:hypothetical protein
MKIPDRQIETEIKKKKKIGGEKKIVARLQFFRDQRLSVSDFKIGEKSQITRFHVILPFAVEAAPFRGMEMLRKLKFGKCTFAREFGECIFSEELDFFLQILIWQICLNLK